MFASLLLLLILFAGCESEERSVMMLSPTCSCTYDRSALFDSINVTTSAYYANSEVCTASNGLCSGVNSGGWSNSSTTSYTSNIVNMTGSSVYITGKVGVGQIPGFNANGRMVLNASDNVLDIYANLSTSTTTGRVMGITAIGETYGRTMFYSDGKVGWGSGAATRDVFLSRYGTNELKVTSDGGSGAGNLRVYGNLYVNGFSKIDSFLTTNQVAQPDNSVINQVPFALAWHDLLAFNQAFVTTYEIYDGSSWTYSTLDTNLFSQREDNNIQVIANETNNASRWTWHTVGWSGATWLGISYAYDGSPANGVTVLVESSADNSTWTVRHNSTYTMSQSMYFHYLTSYGGDNYLRMTLTKNSGFRTISLSTIKLYTNRFGDQGNGREFELPIGWDNERTINITKNLLVTTGYVQIQTPIFPTCNVTNAGAIAYNTSAFKHYGCNSTNWVALY